MHIDWRELRWPLAVFGSLLAVVWVAGGYFAEPETRSGLIASGLLCLGHVVAGVIILDWAAGRTPMSFLKRVLGGMGLRLVAMLIAVVILLKVHAFDASSLTLGLLGWYVLALIFEVITLQKKVALHEEKTGSA